MIFIYSKNIRDILKYFKILKIGKPKSYYDKYKKFWALKP